MNVLELKGYKSFRAFNAFHSLMLGMKMLPMYIGESYEVFYNRFETLPESEQRAMIKQAALFVQLNSEEVEALICFCADKNGIPYGPVNLKNLSPDEILDIIVAVCFEIGKIKIDLTTETEKKK